MPKSKHPSTKSDKRHKKYDESSQSDVALEDEIVSDESDSEAEFDSSNDIDRLLGGIPIFEDKASRRKKESYQAPEEGTVAVNAAFVQREFGSDDQHELCKNEHYRYMRSSDVVGHALITKDANGRIIAQQFQAPGSSDPDDPRIRQLQDIKIFENKYGRKCATAVTTDGTEMVSKRAFDVKTTDEYGDGIQHELLVFSPKANHMWKGDVFWGSDPKQKPPLLKSNLSEDDKKELLAEMTEAKVQYKGGELDIVHKDVPIREGMTRNPDQNKVMGGSAIDEYEAYYETYKDVLSEDMASIVKKSVDARPYHPGGGIKGQYRPEWLHSMGYSLTPLDADPQVATNLAAGRKCDNTSMLATERPLKWFAMNRPDSELHLNCRMKTLPGTQMIDQGMIVGTLKENKREVQLSQFINPHQKYPVFAKPTDVFNTTFTAFQLLNGQKPSSVSEVRISPRLAKTYSIATQPGGYCRVLVDKDDARPSHQHAPETASQKLSQPPVGTAKVQEQKQHNKATVIASSLQPSPTPSVTKTSAKTDVKEPAQVAEQTSPYHSTPDPVPVSVSRRQVAQPGKGKTYFDLQKSVVKIYTTSQMPRYDVPWLGTEVMAWGGSGFVIEKNGQHYVVTNAHVVEDCKNLRIRLANGSEKFDATVKEVSYQADLAILEVDAPAFKAKTEPVQIGDLPNIEDDIRIIGFPIGGDEVTITKGQVSRIEVNVYAQSGENMLQIQTDAACNPGNSGGPAFCGGVLAGVAFQGRDDAQNTGYLIPTPVLNHFLDDVFAPGPFKGFPTLSIAVQPLNNKHQRAFFGLNPDQSGVRVNFVDNQSDAFNKLKKDDVITHIDFVPVGNDAMVNIDEVGSRIDFNYLFQRKHIGENVLLTVVRKNAETDQFETLDIPVTLKYRPGETKKVEAPEHKKIPTFYINSGVAFQPLTNNYLETRKGQALAGIIIPQVGYITEIPKRNMGDQFILINQIFDSKETDGYDEFENAIVDKINGHEINNIQDVVRSMEQHTGDKHKIELKDGDVIILENMSEKKHQRLLDHYRVPADRSPDLKNIAKAKVRGEPGEARPASSPVTPQPSVENTPVKNPIKRLVTHWVLKKSKIAQAAELSDSESDQIDELSAILEGKAAPKSSKKEAAKKSKALSREDLFDTGSSFEEESDIDDGFIVDDSEENAEDYGEMPSTFMINRAPLMAQAKQSGKTFSMKDLVFMDAVDRIAEKYGNGSFRAIDENDWEADEPLSEDMSDMEQPQNYSSDDELFSSEDEASEQLHGNPRQPAFSPMLQTSKTRRRNFVIDSDEEEDAYSSESEVESANDSISHDEDTRPTAPQPRRSARLAGRY